MKMSTTTNTTLTAADLENLDVEELLRGIFASDVDLKDLLRKGIDQIQHTEKITRKLAKAEQREVKKAARQERAVENAELNVHRVKMGVHLGLGAICIGAAAFTPGLNVGLYGLGATQALRAGRATKKALDARKVRDAVRAGAIVEASNEAELREVLGDARFEAILAAVDAGFMVQMGVVAKDPFFMVMAALDALAAGWAGAIWAAAHGQIKPETEAPKPSRVKAGAHKAVKVTASSLVTV